jgi:hypothetical protein
MTDYRSTYREQLDRVRRFLERLEPIEQTNFQDMMWSFFQHCWHLKDWVRHDAGLSPDQKKIIVAAAHASPNLRICRDLCNRTKHLKLTAKPSSGSGARHDHMAYTLHSGSDRASEMDCIIDDGKGKQISGKQLAGDCVGEWERILNGHGLPVDRIS